MADDLPVAEPNAMAVRQLDVSIVQIGIVDRSFPVFQRHGPGGVLIGKF
jgi:hypothetical protein